MSYTKPTLSTFRTLYPAFAAVADATVEAWIDRGDAETAAWPDTDRADAVMLFAAHRMSASGLGTGAMVSGVTSFKSGTFSATVSDAAASRTGYGSTSYGRDFLTLQRRNFGGMTSAWVPPAALDA